MLFISSAEKLSSYLRQNSFKRIGMRAGKLRKHFAVERDILFLESADEFAVGETFSVKGGAEADVPEAAKVIFLVTAVCKSIFTCVRQRFARHAHFRRASKTKTFCLCQDIATSFC